MKVEIVIPCFNEADNLEEMVNQCISIVSTTGVEFIFVDNGSTDRTPAVFSKYVGANKKIRFISTEKNLGYGGGIIFGLEATTSKLIGWMHGDLQTDPNSLKRIVETLKGYEESKAIYFKGKRSGRGLVGKLFTVGMSLFESLLFGMKLSEINAQPTVFSRNLYENWGNAPDDFGLDLFSYVAAKKLKFKILRLKFNFVKRSHGASSWNTDFSSRVKFIKRTFLYSLNLRRGI